MKKWMAMAFMLKLILSPIPVLVALVSDHTYIAHVVHVICRQVTSLRRGNIWYNICMLYDTYISEINRLKLMGLILK